jgi:hypothetical protein
VVWAKDKRFGDKGQSDGGGEQSKLISREADYDRRGGHAAEHHAI